MAFSVVLDGNDSHQFLPKIKVVGIGGAGNNAVSNMIRCGLTGVDFIVANTDAQTLERSPCEYKIQLGQILTSGLGAGAIPMVGKSAAEESRDEIERAINGAHVIFIAAGMGGGTGTGAAPVVAEIAKSKGIMSIGVVTKPFIFEGSERMRVANEGIKELEKYLDTLIVVSNQNLFRIANERTVLTDAFQEADNILYSGVKSITDLFVKPGLINLDLADVRSIISNKGVAMLGCGEASGANRALEAVEIAMKNPLLEDISLNSAKGVLLNVASGKGLTLFEFEKIASFVKDSLDSDDTKFICGSTIDDELDDRIRVSIIATGINKDDPRNNPTTVAQHINTFHEDDGDDSDDGDDFEEDSYEEEEFFEEIDDGISDISELAPTKNVQHRSSSVKSKVSESIPHFSNAKSKSGLERKHSESMNSFDDDEFVFEGSHISSDDFVTEVYIDEQESVNGKTIHHTQHIKKVHGVVHKPDADSKKEKMPEEMAHKPVHSADPLSFTEEIDEEIVIRDEGDDLTDYIAESVLAHGDEYFKEDEAQENDSILANGFWSRIKTSLTKKRKEHEQKLKEKEVKKKIDEEKRLQQALEKTEVWKQQQVHSIKRPQNYELFNGKAGAFIKKNADSISGIMQDLRTAINTKERGDNKNISFLSIKRANQDFLFDVDLIKSKSSFNNGKNSHYN